MVEVTDREFSTMSFYMFRYSLGRMTYAVSETVEFIIKYWDNITENDRILMKDEIRRAIKEERAGMTMDMIEWERILELPNE